MSELWTDDEWRAQMSTADINDLPDSDFAYIEPGGEKDDEGKTTPRSLRHYPIHDAAHVRNALARASAAIAGDNEDAKAIAEKAMPKIKEAANKFDIDVDESKSADDGESRSDCPTCDGSGKIKDGHVKCPDCGGSGDETKSQPRKPRGSRELTLQTKCRRMYAGGIEVRKASADTDALVELSGQVIGYGTPYEVQDAFGAFRETIHYGACTALLADPGLDTCFLVGHDASLVPLARTGAKASLELEDTPDGLQVRAKVDPRMAGAQELILGLENGTISQMSVGMQVDPAGDVWSGEDEFGLPNQRDIYRLARVFDVSAVAFPANPDTELELASARMTEFPPELTVRVQRLERLAKDARQGDITQAEADDLLNIIRRLFTGEERNAPTNQDGKISAQLATVHSALSSLMAAQMKDPDNNTDPVDKKVMAGIKSMLAQCEQTMHDQAKDGNPDAEKPEEKDQAPVGGPDGTQDGNGPPPGAGNQDGSGSRARSIDIDRELRRRRLPPLLLLP